MRKIKICNQGAGNIHKTQISPLQRDYQLQHCIISITFCCYGWIFSHTILLPSLVPRSKREVLLCVIKTILFTGAYSWEQVANPYNEQSCEDTLHDNDDVKRHWTEKMCNKFKKITGKPMAANNFILCCQRVQLKILKKHKTSLMGMGFFWWRHRQ